MRTIKAVKRRSPSHLSLVFPKVVRVLLCVSDSGGFGHKLCLANGQVLRFLDSEWKLYEQRWMPMLGERDDNG